MTKKRTSNAITGVESRGCDRVVTEACLSETGRNGAVTAAADPTTATAAAAKEAVQIAAKERVLKLLKKQASTSDPIKKASLQKKIQKHRELAGTAAKAMQRTANVAVAAPLVAAAAASKIQQQCQQQAQQQPLAGIISMLANTAEELARRAQRQQRFAPELAALKANNSNDDGSAAKPGSSKRAAGTAGRYGTAADADASHAAESWLRLKGGYGSSMAIEKEYLRLTAIPKAEDVRPPEVLQKALALVKQRWREGCSYVWACSQLKSIRQDLTVQGVFDDLTRNAYETHARVALESNDLAEFRQCLARLKQLYRAGVPGSAAEFYGYGVLHAAALGPLQLNQELCRVPQQLLPSPALQHALATVSAYRYADTNHAATCVALLSEAKYTSLRCLPNVSCCPGNFMHLWVINRPVMAAPHLSDAALHATAADTGHNLTLNV
eukprot:GHRR01005386.1.p1 GENE.GHRR01005386.1~~GHRR01005386.1.p1  ORF type:complete len:440 (+),score=191.13 GHRR01005386.1:691-2010(+)